MTTHKRHKAIITIINDSVGKLVIPAEAGMQGRYYKIYSSVLCREKRLRKLASIFKK